MTRPVDLGHREAILDRIAGYVLEHGMAGLSLRPLAQAVGLSPRTLLHHFGSKEAIVAAVFGRIRKRQRVAFDALRRSRLPGPAGLARAAFDYMRSDEMLPAMQLFFETYARAVRDPQVAPGFLESAVGDWLDFFSDPECSGTSDPVRARIVATVLLAGYRGFMLDYVATRDAARIGPAMEAWMLSLQSLSAGDGAA